GEVSVALSQEPLTERKNTPPGATGRTMPARSTPGGLWAGVAAGDAAPSAPVAGGRPATATVGVSARQGMERGGRIMVLVSKMVAVHAPRRASLHDGRGVESRRALRE